MARCPLLLMPPLLASVLACCCLLGPPAAQASSLADSVVPLYQAHEKFLDLIQPADRSLLLQDIAPVVLGSYSNILEYFRLWNWTTYPRAMIGFSVLVGIGLFLIIVVPLVGCCVCCCRCCCSNCGGRLNYMERKGAACRRGSYGFCLLLMTSLLLFGAVLAFVSNQLLRDQLNSGGSGSSGSSSALNDFSTACSNVADILQQAPRRGREATTAAVSTATAALLPSVNRTLARLQADLSHGNATDAVATIAATEAALQELASAQRSSASYAAGHAGCSDQLTSFNRTMSATRKNLTLPAPFACPPGADQVDCDLVNASLADLLSELNADSFGHAVVNEMSDRLARVVNVTETLLGLAEARAALGNITVAGMDMVKNGLADAEASLNGSQLMEFWSSLDTHLTAIARDIKRATNLTAVRLTNPIPGAAAANQSLADLVSQFDSYRYYGYIGLASFLLLLVVLFYSGLLFGCGGEPPYEDAGCCNRGVGANCLLAGAALAWLLYALLMTLVMLGFLSGGLVDTQACRYLTGRAGSPGYRMLDDLVTPLYGRLGGGGGGRNVSLNLTAAVTDRPVTALLSGCRGHHNGSLAGSLVDIPGLSWALQLAPLVDGFLNNTMRDLAKRGSELLSGGGNGGAFNASRLEEARELARNASDVNFDPFILELSRPLSVANLTQVLAAMSRIASNTTDAAAAARFSELSDSLARSHGLAASSVNQQLAELERLTQSLNRLNTSLASLPERVAATGAALRSQHVLLAALQSASAGLAQEVVALAESQLLPGLLDQSLSCPDLAAGLNRGIAAPCVGLLRPFIGYWAGLGICLLALLPCLVLAIKLANLYRKTQKYLADFDDGNPKPV